MTLAASPAVADGKPLWSPEAEQAVLGAMLLDQDAALRALQMVDDTMFFREGHRPLFRAMRDLLKHGSVIDPVTLPDALERRGELAQVGGPEYVAELVDAAPTAANLEHHAKILQDYARRRLLVEVAGQAITAAYDGRTSVAATAERVIQALLAGPARDPNGPQLRWAREYYEHPELLVPPPEVIPRLAYQGRSTLLAGLFKLGKSTLIRCAIAAMARGQDFFGGRTTPGPTLWQALDEPGADLVRGLHALDVPGDAVGILTRKPSHAELRRLILEHGFKLLVVDALMNYAADVVTDPFKPTEWLTLLTPLNEILRETNAAAVLLHHTVRDGTRFADSRQIGASVDQIVTMTAVERDPTLREIATTGRVRSERFTTRFAQGRYALDEGELPLPLRIYRAIASEPGIGSRALAARVGGKTSDLYATLADLLAKGVIGDRGNGRGGRGKEAGHRYEVRAPITEAGPGLPGNDGCAKGEQRVSDRDDLPSALGEPGCAKGEQRVSGNAHPLLRESEGEHAMKDSTQHPVESPEQFVNTPGSRPGSDRRCRLHRAGLMEISPLTGAAACRLCTPDLFLDAAPQLVGATIGAGEFGL